MDGFEKFMVGILADLDDFSSGMVHGMHVGFWWLASLEFDGSDCNRATEIPTWSCSVISSSLHFFVSSFLRFYVSSFLRFFVSSFLYFPSSPEVQAFGIHDDRLTATIIVNAGNAGTRSLFGKLNSRSGKVHSPRLWQNGDDLLDLG
ncbi:hypothetical protein WN943_029199 [Citrus x changshan-huyou]